MRVRNLSCSGLSEYELYNDEYNKKSPDKPIHRPVQSLFSSSSGFTNFRGLINWAILLLVITTARLALENILKYGIVMDPLVWARFILHSQNRMPAIGLIICANIFIVTGWLIESFVAKKWLGETATKLLICANLTSTLVFPSVVIFNADFTPFFSSPALSIYTIVFLKLCSYSHVNLWCRQFLTEKQSRRAAAAECSHQQQQPLAKEFHGDEDRVIDDDSAFEGSPPGDDDDDDASEASHATTTTEKEFDSIELKFNSRPATENELVDVRRRSFSWRYGNLLQPKQSSLDASLKRLRTDSPARPARHSLSSLSALAAESNRHESTLEVDPLLYHSDTLELLQSIWRHQVRYPDNLTLSNLYYFMLAPTLCYELNFPRTLSINKSNLFHRLIELFFIPQLVFCLLQQWVVPIVAKSTATFSQGGLGYFVERCLKLALPNHLLWLLLFYCIFHSLMNVLAELLRFGDRFFYSDWWNAETINAFWSKWNIPVHRFCRRHIYMPLISTGLTRGQAAMVVFLISALLHEFLLSVPLKMPRIWAFLGMSIQLPVGWLIAALLPRTGPWGNVSLWLSLIIGQPLAILFYYHDYYVMRQSAASAATLA